VAADGLESSAVADWRIVVTHFPPYWGHWDWVDMAKRNEIDLFITGHRHSQWIHVKDDPFEMIWPNDPEQLGNNFIDPSAYVVSGGGGGVTSEQKPEWGGNDDEYGYMDMELYKDYIKLTGISHGSQTRKVSIVNHEYHHKGSRAIWEDKASQR